MESEGLMFYEHLKTLPLMILQIVKSSTKTLEDVTRARLEGANKKSLYDIR